MISVLAGIAWTINGSLGNTGASNAEFVALQKTLLEYMNGGPVKVAPSPAACLNDGIPTSYHNKLQEWWRGKGDCERVYTPNPASVISPVTSGIISQFFPEHEQGMLETLSKLQVQMKSPSTPLIKKLEIQSTAWELLAGIYLNFDEKNRDAKKLLQLKSRAQAVLCSTLLSDAEIQKLPDNLSSFIPGYKSEMLERILRHDPEIVEIAHSGGLHRGLSRDRLSTRVFITVDQKDQKRFHEMLNSYPQIQLIGFPWAGKMPPIRDAKFRDLASLGDDFEGVHAVLVLYFNVFDKELHPVATNLVAGWQEYTITGRMDQSKPAIENISKIQFTTIEYQRNFDISAVPPFSYRALDDSALSNPSSVFETSPVYPNVPCTTRRGKCLACHTDAVGSFFTMQQPSKLTLTPPLYKPLAAVNGGNEFKKFMNFLGACQATTSENLNTRVLEANAKANE